MRIWSSGRRYSSALETLFQRKDFAGLGFEDLLKDIVSEKTLATALKFVKVLWAERTNEKLVKSINPLGEVEVHLAMGRGKFDTRYLDFEFHRVRVDGKITHVLVSVSDVSSRVELARELQSSQQQAQAQVDTLLGILHVDPAQLASFLSDSNAAMKMINAVLREPAREESAFRKKLDTLFRQAHSVKGEAAALGLSSIESRAHSFEDDLKALREKPDLSGNDFLPLVIKLDDLLTHLQSVGDLVSRLSKFQLRPHEAPAHGPRDATSADRGRVRAGHRGRWRPMRAWARRLQQLAERVARRERQGGEARSAAGSTSCPRSIGASSRTSPCRRVRNAIVHGIEPAAARVAAGKPPQGTVRLDFQDHGEAATSSASRTTGRDSRPSASRRSPLQKGFITADQADNLDAKQVLALLFQPGFLHRRDRHQGCGARRRHESHGRSDAPDRRAGGGRDRAGKIHAGDHDAAARAQAGRRYGGCLMDTDTQSKLAEAHDRR